MLGVRRTHCAQDAQSPQSCRTQGLQIQGQDFGLATRSTASDAHALAPDLFDRGCALLCRSYTERMERWHEDAFQPGVGILHNERDGGDSVDRAVGWASHAR